MHIPKELLTQLNRNQEKIIIISEKGDVLGVLLSYPAYTELLCRNQVAAIRNEKSKMPTLSKEKSEKLPYELTSDKFLDKINLDIAQQREVQIPINVEEGSFTDLKPNFNNDETLLTEGSDDTIYLETINENE